MAHPLSVSNAKKRGLASAGRVILCVGLLAGFRAPTVAAQTDWPRMVRTSMPAAAAPIRESQVRLLVGRSTLLEVGRPISRVSVTTPDVADALITTPQQLLIHGKAPGTISLFVWDDSGSTRSYDIVVERDLDALAGQLEQLFPGESIQAASNGRDVVLSGTVSTKYVVDNAAAVAAGYVESDDDIVNLLKQDEGDATTQVMLRVRFAEVTRSALTELGASLFTGPNGHMGWLGRTTTQQFAAPVFDENNGEKTLVFSDFLNLFLFDADEQLGGLIKALKSKGLFQSLAEPNLIAQNGTEASFLAGGEYPYPAVQGGSTNLAVTVQFKEFGVRLHFTPTLLGGDRIHLKVNPEVSALDFTNAVSVQGFRIPSLTTRRAETQVELRDGQTFAIAGLLNNTMTETMQKIPGIGDIPILGLLFRSKALQRSDTELVVMITPQILRQDSTGVASDLPQLEKPFEDLSERTEPTPARAPRTLGSAPAADPADAFVEDAPAAVTGTYPEPPADPALLPLPVAEPVSSMPGLTTDPVDEIPDPAADPYDAMAEPAADPYDTMPEPTGDPYDAMPEPAGDLGDLYDEMPEPAANPYDAVPEPAADPYGVMPEPTEDPADTIPDPGAESVDPSPEPSADPMDTPEPAMDPVGTMPEPGSSPGIVVAVKGTSTDDSGWRSAPRTRPSLPSLLVMSIETAKSRTTSASRRLARQSAPSRSPAIQLAVHQSDAAQGTNPPVETAPPSVVPVRVSTPLSAQPARAFLPYQRQVRVWTPEPVPPARVVTSKTAQRTALLRARLAQLRRTQERLESKTPAGVVAQVTSQR